MAVDPNQDPFAAIGGGKRRANGDWIPMNMEDKTANALPPPSPTGAPASSANALPGPQSSNDVLKQATPIGGTPTQGAPGTVAGAFQQALVNRLAPPPVTAQSAELQPAIQANQLAEQRGTEQQRAFLAERNAAQGLNNSGASDTGNLGIIQDSTARQGQFAGNLVNDLNKQRSAEGLATQGLVGSMLGQTDALSQQDRLAQLDAQLRREGLGVQSQLGQGDLSLRGELGRGNLNLGLLGLLQGGQQFGQNLASNNAQFGAGLNQNALLQALGML